MSLDKFVLPSLGDKLKHPVTPIASIAESPVAEVSAETKPEAPTEEVEIKAKGRRLNK